MRFSKQHRSFPSTPSNFAHHEPNSQARELFASNFAPYSIQQNEKRKMDIVLSIS
jgi:hypothetical protein